MTPKNFPYFQTASTLLGAFFLLFSLSCKEKLSTSDWQQQNTTLAATQEARPKNPTKTKLSDKEPASHQTPSHPNKPVRFLAYNLKNYLTMPRYINKQRTNTPKPEAEISALIETIQAAQPDIIGICEIGTPEDLTDLQNRLKKIGIKLPHKHQMLGFDSIRTLAILSKFPIVSTNKVTKIDYQVGGAPFQMSRGILDTTIQLPNKQVRCIGIHFKSKRPIPQADQELMRRAEAGLLRTHVDQILNESPNTNLLVYGDFNDTKRTPTLRTSMGRLNSKTGLVVLNPKDSRGDLWTHHWKRENIYSRIDFVMVSKNLNPYIDKTNTQILDPENWETASDHRAILVPIQ